MASSTDHELATWKIESYRGIARVSLGSLNFEHSLVKTQHREISWQNVHRIEKIYERNGCLRFEGDNIINAIISDNDLEEALEAANITAEFYQSIQWPRDAPTLGLAQVKCLSGLHRIEAAKNFLDENDKWWVVRLFSNTTPPSLLTRIIESYANEQKPADGEIFRKIRLYHRANDQSSEDRWWACLDRSKLKDLRQLFKRRQLLAAFDELIDMPGLWTRIQLGALHRLLALKCDEEMVSYLKHVAEVWRKILQCGEVIIPGPAVDFNTVERLELLSPRHSTADKELFHDLMQRKVLFPSQTDPRARDALLHNICNLSCLIPSLRTFFEMLKFVEPTCAVLKQLIGKDDLKGTIRLTMMGRYFRPSKILLQVSEWNEAEITGPLDDKTTSRLAYTELWAYCSRHIDDLVSFTPRKESGEARPSIKCRNPVAWQNLATFALSRGFRLPCAEDMAKDDSRLELALDYLRQANPTISQFSEEHVRSVRDASQPTSQNALSSPSEDNEHIDVERRVGRPFAGDFAKDQLFLFVPRIFAPLGNLGITHTLARQDLFTTLFGCLKDLVRRCELGPITNMSPGVDLMEVDPNPQIENSAPTEQCDEPLFQDASVAQVSRLQKKVTELHKKGKDRVQEKDRLLATKQAECEGLVQEINSLRRDKENLKNEVQDLNAQLALLRKEHKKVKKDLQRATERSKKPSLGVNKSKKKILLALQNDMSLVAANSPPDLTSPMETSVSSPTSENTAGLVQLGPIEQIWTKTLDGALEMFFLKSADPNVGLKGCSYPVIDEPTADMTINRIFEVVRDELGSAPAVCAPTRKRIPWVEQAPGVAGAGFLTSLRDQRTVFIGSEAVISEFQASGTTLPNDTSHTDGAAALGSNVPGAWNSLINDPDVFVDASEGTPVVAGQLLNAPPRKGISTKDKHRTQLRVVEDRTWRENAKSGDSSDDSSSDDELPRKINGISG